MIVEYIEPQRCKVISEYLTRYLPSSDAKTHLLSALAPDTNVHHYIVRDLRGVAGAISFTVYKNRVNVFNLGSVVKGGGTLLMEQVERIAFMNDKSVTLLATPGSINFYLKRGFKMVGKHTPGGVTMSKGPK